MKIRVIGSLFLVFAILFTFGCGGGGGGAPATTVISGVASKGAVSGATVTVFAITGGAKGTPLGQPATTSTTGAFSIDIGPVTGPVLVEVTGDGRYTDEATGSVKSIQGTTLRAVVPNATLGTVSVAVTPLTEVAAMRMNNNYQAATIAEANAAVGLLFGVSDIIATQPADANYAVALGTVSHYMQDTVQDLPAALADFKTAIDAATPAATANPLLAALVTARNKALANTAANPGGIGAPVGATTATVKLSTKGTLPAGTKIGSIQLNVILPTGVTVTTDATPAIVAASLTLSGVADVTTTTGAQKIIAGSFTPASGSISPAKATIGLANTDGFTTGEVATLKCNVAAQSRIPASSFLMTGLEVLDPAGNPVSGVTAELTVSIP